MVSRMRVWGLVAMVVITLAALVGITFIAKLSGAEEVPPVTTPATGEAVFTLSEDGMSMRMVCQ